MRKAERVLTVIVILLLVCGVILILYPIKEQQQAIARDDYLYEEIALSAREPTATGAIIDVVSETPLPSLLPSESCATVSPPAQEDSSEAFTALLPGTPPDSTVQFSVLQEQNKDFVAWLSIPGTVVDYPVVRSDDIDYYLHHLFTGQQSKLGCLFSLTTSDYLLPGKNIAIYGHHLSNSDAMFSTLISYKDESYYREHPLIRVDSIYGNRQYAIFAVLNQKVTDWDASTASFSSDEAFRQYVQRAQRLSMYETGVAVEADDHILTLITCDRSYGGLRGRLVIMAVEIKQEET